MNRAGNKQVGMRQGKAQGGSRNRGANCFSTGQISQNAGGFCRKEMESPRSPRDEDRQLRAESVVGNEERHTTTNLQMLKEQADRLTRALKNVEAQIKAFQSE